MDHAEVRERMEAAVAGPGGLAALVAEPSPDAVALREHVRGCDVCTAEWRAWSVMSLGLAAAAPDELRLRPAAREAILGSILAGPRSAVAAERVAAIQPSAAVPSAPFPYASSTPSAPPSGSPTGGTSGTTPPARPTGVTGGRAARAAGTTAGTTRTPRRTTEAASGRPWFRWLALGAAAAVLLFVVGAAFGRQLGGGGGPTGPTTADLSQVIRTTSDIMERPGSSVTQLYTPSGDRGGFVAASTSGDLVVASTALTPPPDGVRYICLLERDGTSTQVGYMHFDDTLAYWAGPVDDPDRVGQSGDVFIVQLDTPGSPAALTGTF